MNAMRRWTENALFAALIIWTITACVGAASPQATPGTAEQAGRCPEGVCTPALAELSETAAWTQAPPDPTREILLAETRSQMSDRGTDIIYVLSMMELHHRQPTTGGLAEALADRDRHEECLLNAWNSIWQATEPGADTGLPDRETRRRAETLVKCAMTEAQQWRAAKPAQRKEWTSRLLEAAARLDNPAERARAAVANETSDKGWLELYEVFKPCEDQTELVAEAIATVEEPREASGAVAAAVRQTRECASKLTQRHYPEPQKEPSGKQPSS